MDTQTDPSSNDTLTLEELAKTFRINLKHAYHLAKYDPDKLPVKPIRFGRQYRFSASAVHDLIHPTRKAVTNE